MEETIKFELTGNFQYDAGLFGLKRVIDFFGEEYKSDSYSIEINIGLYERLYKLYILYSYLYLSKQLKLLPSFLEALKTKKDGYKIKNDLKNLIEKANLSDLVVNNKEEDIIEVIKNISACIEEISRSYEFSSNKKFNEDLTALSEKPFPQFYILELTHQNYIANKRMDLKQMAEELKKRFSSSLEVMDSTNSCDFCGNYKGVIARKTNLFYAPNFINFEWHGDERTGIKICNACSVTNYFIKFAFSNGLFIYSSNFNDMLEYNEGLDSLTTFIRKIIAKKIASEKNLTVVEANFNNRDPLFNIYHFSQEQLFFITENWDIFNGMGDSNFLGRIKIKKRGRVSYDYFNFFNEVCREYLSGTRDFILLVDRLLYYYMRQEIDRIKNIEELKSVYSGFRIYPLIFLLKLNCKLGGRDMNELNEFKDFGKNIKGYYWDKLKNNRNRENTHRNKMITFSNYIRDSVNRGKSSFMEALVQLAITAEQNIPKKITEAVLNDILDYKEAGYAIALGMLTIESSKKEQNQIEIIPDENEEVLS